jgi:hypothetical protein
MGVRELEYFTIKVRGNWKFDYGGILFLWFIRGVVENGVTCFK